ncbi:MAG: 50S ribosomal protein L30 [Candidatus Thorarchaeota archaeon]
MSKSTKTQELLAVVRIRGSVDRTQDVLHALKLLHLTRPNHAVVIPNDDVHKGMMQQLKDVVTWGEINKETLTALIVKRGRTQGNKKIDDKFLKDRKFDSIDALVTALMSKKADMRKIEGLKPLFRLHPPKKGFKSVKDTVAKGGDLGYRGENINVLLDRMI